MSEQDKGKRTSLGGSNIPRQPVPEIEQNELLKQIEPIVVKVFDMGIRTTGDRATRTATIQWAEDEILAKAKRHYEAVLKQAVMDSAGNKDIDLPETLYEIFCSIQNQAIGNHEQKGLDRSGLGEKIANALGCGECVALEDCLSGKPFKDCSHSSILPKLVALISDIGRWISEAFEDNTLSMIGEAKREERERIRATGIHIIVGQVLELDGEKMKATKNQTLVLIPDEPEVLKEEPHQVGTFCLGANRGEPKGGC